MVEKETSATPNLCVKYYSTFSPKKPWTSSLSFTARPLYGPFKGRFGTKTIVNFPPLAELEGGFEALRDQ